MGRRGRGRRRPGRQAAAADLAEGLAAGRTGSGRRDARGVYAASHRLRRLPQFRDPAAAHPRPATSGRWSSAPTTRACFITPASASIGRARPASWIGPTPEPGFAVMPEDEVRNVYGWSPGKAPFHGSLPTRRGRSKPAATSWRSCTCCRAASRKRSRPSIGLFFTDTPPTRVPLVVTLQSKTIDIPAGQPDYIDRGQLRAAGRCRRAQRVSARALSGDRHEGRGDAAGRNDEMAASGSKPGTSTGRTPTATRRRCFLPKGTTLTMTFTYDNSDRNPRNPNHPARADSLGTAVDRTRWARCGSKSSPVMPRTLGLLMQGQRAARDAGGRGACRNAGRDAPRRRAGAQLSGRQVSASGPGP